MRWPLTCCGSASSSKATARRPGAATSTTAGFEPLDTAAVAASLVARSRSSTWRRVRGYPSLATSRCAASASSIETNGPTSTSRSDPSSRQANDGRPAFVSRPAITRASASRTNEVTCTLKLAPVAIGGPSTGREARVAAGARVSPPAARSHTAAVTATSATAAAMPQVLRRCARGHTSTVRDRCEVSDLKRGLLRKRSSWSSSRSRTV